MLEVAVIWHEINNSLTAINLTLDFLHRHTVGISAKDLKHELGFSLQSLDHIKNVLKIASSTQSTAVTNNSRFRLDDLVKIAIQILSRKWPKAQICVVEKSPNLELYGDKTAMMQVIMNLIANALESYQTTDLAGKFVADLAANLRVRITLNQAVNERISILVQDWGAGIPAAARGRIFEQYFSLKKSRGGTGIGLAVSKQIIEEKFGGQISFTSRVGQGTTFTVVVPG